ncbi:Rrf2 family transcriptional regulator [Psychromonas sp. Urea-02u-13]|uniref:Rrf2 family transcriptional regulator n=1 Tax=Psychromonas sp. Urea-02u-13 TaxID=2058326 RepID=UPI000C34674A|nr:Rrf2 family transcriptional regulator [Psychromonas sp. Urea-02u-13]PKG38862.1 Rrf2 family transcriptional regulator [Psychromonas sp. Urea-02u-13]
MHITRYTDYSLRVLIYLAINNQQLSTINDIAKSYSISKNHLMKIVQQLSHRGFVLAIRGKNGGIKLNRAANEINIGNLVREIEDKNKLVECFGGDNQCVITPSCQLKKIFAQAQESFFKTLDDYTLENLVGGQYKNTLTELLIQDVS